MVQENIAISLQNYMHALTGAPVAKCVVSISAAEEVVDMRGGSAELTQTYFYSLVR